MSRGKHMVSLILKNQKNNEDNENINENELSGFDINFTLPIDEITQEADNTIGIVEEILASLEENNEIYNNTAIISEDDTNIINFDNIESIQCIKETKKSRQKKRNSGKKYISSSGKLVCERKFNRLQHCRMKCIEKVTIEEQKEIFEKYWKLSHFNLRLVYIGGLITSQCTKTKSNVRSETHPRDRPMTFNYNLELNGKRTTVCKKCFQMTFDETDRFLKTVQTKIAGKGEFVDQRGKKNPTNKLSTNILNQVKDFVKDFPAYESHYTRRDSSRKYFSADLTMKKLFDLFKEKNGSLMSITKFAETVKQMNIHFKKPKLDTCGKCDVLNIKIEAAANDSEKQVYMEELQKHQEEADIAYEKKKADKEMQAACPNLKVFTFDLQKCLPTPFLQTNIAFYKRSLWTYNLTIYELLSNIPTNYMWHEAIANRGGNEIASCLFKHLQSLPHNITHVILYSDSCIGQNKNSFVSAMFSLFVKNSPFINVIEHKFLTPGHTHMECDSAHAAIEKSKNKTSMKIYIPRDWCFLVENAGKKFKVVEMEQDQFYDFSSVARNKFVWRQLDNSGNRFSWHHERWLKFTKEFGIIAFKKSLNDNEEFKLLKILKRGCNANPLSDLKLCYTVTLPISNCKKKDLEDMLKLIPPTFHEFYKCLPSQTIPDYHPDITEEETIEEA